MGKVKNNFVERRRYVRLQVPISVAYVLPGNSNISLVTTKNISADGLRFQAHDKLLKESAIVELKLDIPGVINPIHAKGKIIWGKKISLEDSAPFDFGLEFVEIEEDNKNTFLKFLCDLIYSIPQESEYVENKA